jgi:pyruvate,water dikinase
VTAATAPLADLRAPDASRFGGKSASLGELLAGGIPVPEGFGISIDAFEAFLDAPGVREGVHAALAGLDVDDVSAVAAASQAAVRALEDASFPPDVRAEVTERYAAVAERAGEAAPPVAVRSSAIGEDSAEATFAGQQETFLWVRGADGVCEAVRRCWASLFSPPALTYRARRGDPAQEAAMAVAVQRMIDADVAGVLFTCNPVNGDPSVVAVNASWGLGVAVVGGDVTPDEYHVNKVTGELVLSTIGAKEVEYRPDPSGAGSVEQVVPEDRVNAPCLDDAGLAQLLDVAGAVERWFGCHQDIEWAFAADGTLSVLQARPVTVVPRPEIPTGASALSLVMATFGVTPKHRDGA